ncbi:PREDICTED: odorant receptor 4-like [Eufriesea mexicana]|uniref:odorant receptor 4-like n=1 Tax=Eufriesea mexicana TaxID=516756 RepID=UPI00083BB740|nr:PREDICTED: odorant receptor 4-like [Eufriesea mexicana]
MPGTKSAEEDLNQILKPVYFLLKLIGAWPNSHTSTTLFSKVSTWCLILVSYFLQLMVLVPGILYIIMIEKNGRKQLKMIIPHINCFCQLSKYTILLRQSNKLSKILDKLRNDMLSASEENRKIFRMRANIGHKVVIILAITMYGGGLCYRTILPLSVGKIVLPNNATVRLLPCPSYFIFLDEQSTPNYGIIFILQVLGGFINYTTLCGTIGLCSILCLHLSSMLRILINKMIELTKQADMSEMAVQEKIADIVEQQSDIRGFLTLVEQITPYLYFFEIFDDVCIACVTGYCIIVEWVDNNLIAIIIYLMLQVTCMFSTFSICYIGQLLMDESNEVRLTSITLNWYRLPAKKAQSLILVIIMSNYPIKVTAGKIADISLSTFTDIIKTSMGYLNILQKMV